MEFLHKDCNENLIRYIPDDALDRDNIAFFYLSRRSFLEVMPELLTSGLMLITWISIINVFGYLIEPVIWRFFIAGLVGGMLFFYPLGFELWRWKREIYYLTQGGFYHSYFDLRSLSQISEQIGWMTSAKARKYSYYELLGINVGFFETRSADGRRVLSALLVSPFILQRRFSETRSYQPKGK